MELAESIQNTILSEYGLLVFLLVVAVGLLWRRNEKRDEAYAAAIEKTHTVIEANTKAFTELSLKIDALRR